MKPSRPRIGRPRRPAIETAAAGTMDGTVDIIQAVVKDSTGVLAWRPVRAAALRAMEPSRVWMTAAEFRAFCDRCYPRDRKRLENEVGITRRRRDGMLAGLKISKQEALACAHAGLGLPLPVPAGDVKAFEAWFSQNFRTARGAAKALEIKESTILERMVGFKVQAGARLARAPEIDLIRALDWCLRMGPICPFNPQPQENLPCPS